MSSRSPADPDSRVLTETAAARLLERASELEAARGAGFALADLRAAALEAGISAPAFEAALAELPPVEMTPAARVGGRPRPKRRSGAFAAVAAILVAAVATFTTRTVVPPTAATVQESILLRCLAPGEAAALVRPLLQDGAGAVVASPTIAPRVLTIRATPARMERVKAVIAEYESGGSATCGSPRPASTSP